MKVLPIGGKTILSILAFIVMTVATASSARADIIVVQGVNNTGTDNVLLNPATDVSTVTGTVNSGLFTVNFVSASGSQLLSANPSGQATVSGGTGNSPFTDITFSIAGGATFTRAVFNINAATDGSVVLTVEGINITGGTFTETFEVDANGENFFTVTAINGQLITSINLSGTAGATFEDLRQVRIGGLAAPPTNQVPEPASMFLLGSGLVGLAAGLRRRMRR
jgi:hypothetical protein